MSLRNLVSYRSKAEIEAIRQAQATWLEDCPVDPDSYEGQVLACLVVIKAAIEAGIPVNLNPADVQALIDGIVNGIGELTLNVNVTGGVITIANAISLSAETLAALENINATVSGTVGISSLPDVTIDADSIAAMASSIASAIAALTLNVSLSDAQIAVIASAIANAIAALTLTVSQDGTWTIAGTVNIGNVVSVALSADDIAAIASAIAGVTLTANVTIDPAQLQSILNGLTEISDGIEVTIAQSQWDALCEKLEKLQIRWTERIWYICDVNDSRYGEPVRYKSRCDVDGKTVYPNGSPCPVYLPAKYDSRVMLVGKCQTLGLASAAGAPDSFAVSSAISGNTHSIKFEQVGAGVGLANAIQNAINGGLFTICRVTMNGQTVFTYDVRNTTMTGTPGSGTVAFTSTLQNDIAGCETEYAAIWDGMTEINAPVTGWGNACTRLTFVETGDPIQPDCNKPLNPQPRIVSSALPSIGDLDADMLACLQAIKANTSDIDERLDRLEAEPDVCAFARVDESDGMVANGNVANYAHVNNSGVYVFTLTNPAPANSYVLLGQEFHNTDLTVDYTFTPTTLTIRTKRGDNGTATDVPTDNGFSWEIKAEK